MLKNRYLSAATLDEHIQSAEKNRELWTALRGRAVVEREMVRRVESLRGHWHLLALSEDWCGDAVNTLPAVGALAGAASNLDLRVLERDANPDLMDAHLTHGSRSIPVVMVLDAEYRERGWWGPRPAPLQAWVMAEGMEIAPRDRYREIRAWYARDRGRTTLSELVALLEAAARGRSEAVA